jgi:hypothetical protein
MAQTSHNPEPIPWLDLGDPLRLAVQQVRQSPPPPDAVSRCVSRARLIGQSPRRGWVGRRMGLLVTGAVAATLLIVLGLGYRSFRAGGFLAGLRWRGEDHASRPAEGEKERLREQMAAWVPGRHARREMEALLNRCSDSDLELPKLVGVPLEPERPSSKRLTVAAALEEVTRRVQKGQSDGAVRLLLGLRQDHLEDSAIARLVGYRLLVLDRPALAAQKLAEAIEEHPADTSLHRALAAALSDAGRPARAALHYETVLAQLGSNNNLLLAVRTEYGQLKQQVNRDKGLSDDLRAYLTARLPPLPLHEPPGNLVIILTWTEGSAPDLIIRDPDGKEGVISCPAGNVPNFRGPALIAKQTPQPGEYEVQVRLGHPLSAGVMELCVRVEIRHNAAGGEKVTFYRVLLRQPGERVSVAKIKS